MSDTNTRFVWFEHMSGASDEARRFYGEVLPWSIDDVDMGLDAPYPMIKVGEAPIGGFAPLPKADVPPHWVAYISVADVDAAAKKVISAGGKSLMDAFDIPNVGRAQPVADPEGGALLLFTSAEGDGPAAKGPGAFHWNELWADDPEALRRFYEKAFDLDGAAMEMPNGTYHLLKAGETSIAGIMKKPAAEIPTHWLPYVEVTDADAAVKRATKNGGELVGEVMNVPEVGRFGIIKDPQGATLGLIKPAS